MRVCLFEDRAEQFEPLCWTRPVFELRCGMTTLGAKQRRHVGAGASWGALVRPALEGVLRLQHPGIAVNDADWLAEDDLLLVNSRWLPPDDALLLAKDAHVGAVDDGVAYVVLKKGMFTSIAFEQLSMLLQVWQHTLPARAAHGVLLGYPWDLVEHNADEIRRDFGWLKPTGDSFDQDALAVIGPRGQLQIAASASIEPMVVIDTTHGPVVIDEQVKITAFTRLEGPCHIAAHAQVHGAKVRGGTSIGPHCRVGGEVEASILHGYANKYHEGFLGHSYVGAWVNLGAGTHNSDLRNDYGEVVMLHKGARFPTGMTKVGCFLGDHVKTGLGTLLNTGTSVGPFCNVLPAGGYAPKFLPSFTTWWNGSLREAFTLDQLLSTAQTVLQRRGMTLTDAHKSLYAWLLEETADERRRALRESQQRQLRRSA